ncbi:hypothetical protein BN12_4000012 [Nostocoides japonicum T1-X7]|uniref:Uncharacterized protein n=1 Tax=Nostocoides japonicum T1-X7 TaxID=1194083 RepID=A0A077M4S6_9MICO|nr:hypothetical protein BN12_4000012 [Tetrasphaera japonica T1-X7]
MAAGMANLLCENLRHTLATHSCRRMIGRA